METFPTTVSFSYPLKLESAFKTIVTDFESGKEQRRKRWAFPKRKVGLNYRNVSPSSFNTLWAFYQARSGAYEAFSFIHPRIDYWYGEYVGMGNGTQATFDLPSVGTTNDATLVVYKDGVSSAFSFISGGGEAGADRVTMSVTPANGTILTADFYGKIIITARFAQDNLSKDFLSYLYYNSEVSLIEVH